MESRESSLFWDSQADTLASVRARALNGAERAHWEEALFSLLPSDKPLRILDAGSGSGFLSVMLASRGHNVVGIDISPVMVQCAYETASAMGQRIEYRIMDCRDTDFADESFDAIVCCEVLSHIPDPQAAWTEFRRILQKEGHVILFDTGKLTTQQAQAQGFSHCRVRDFASLTAINPKAPLHCISARKPAHDDQHGIPQIALFKRHVQTAKKQIQFYQNWCQSVGMPYPEYTVLNMISRHPKGCRPADISTALVMPPQTLSRILANLHNEGYIAKQTSERDRRSTIRTITESGQQRIQPLQDALRAIEQKALTRFSIDELTRLSELSDQILSELDSAFHAQTTD